MTVHFKLILMFKKPKVQTGVYKSGFLYNSRPVSSLVVNLDLIGSGCIIKVHLGGKTASRSIHWSLFVTSVLLSASLVNKPRCVISHWLISGISRRRV